MASIYHAILSFITVVLFSLPAWAADGDPIHLIPEPVHMEARSGTFVLDDRVNLATDSNDPALRKSLNCFTETVKSVTGVTIGRTGSKEIRINLNKTADSQLGNEGYRLAVAPGSILLTANTAAGAFYGMQTILQLLPPALTAGTGDWQIPAVNITDYPRFGWRGLMLDVSRHFFTKDEVKRFIDEMVRYKYNTFHWHLTDDNGWRIEIKALPELTQKGAYRVKRTGRWG